MENSPIIKSGYTDSTGRYFANVRNVAFSRKQNIFEYMGSPIITSSSNGYLILNNNDRSDVAYKMSQELINYQQELNYRNFYYAVDVNPQMINDLQNRQFRVRNTLFPDGIVTIDGYPVAQVIPYFRDSVTLKVFLEQHDKFVLPLDAYLQVLNNLKELYDNGICYSDIHLENFLVNVKTGKVDIIDFNVEDIYIMDSDNVCYDFCAISLQDMLNNANKSIGIEDEIILNSENPIEDATEKIFVLSQKYR